MNLEQLLKKLPELYTSGIPVHMQSIPGLGKTSVMRQACKVLSKEYGEEFGFIDMLIPTVDAQDLKGYLIPHKNEDGTATSLYTQPNVLREIEATGLKRGIIAFDEFRQGEQLTQKACAEPILAHKIGTYQIPEGWYIIMASNRAKDKSGAGKSMAHITNRVCVLDIEPSVDAWCTWAADHNIHPMGLGFARAFPGVVFNDEPPADPDQAFCTARSFTRAMEFLSQSHIDASGEFIMEIKTDPLTNEIVNGLVGASAGAEMGAYFKCAELMPSYEEMMANPKGCKLPPGARLDAQYGVSAMVIHYADAKSVDKLFIVAERLVKELQTTTILGLLKKSGGTLLNAKSLNTWISQNRTLVSASMS